MQSVLQINPKVKGQLTRLMGPGQARRILLSAGEVSIISGLWDKKIKRTLDQMTAEILENAGKTGRLALTGVDFSDLIMRHSLEIMGTALEHSVEFISELPKSPTAFQESAAVRLASKKPGARARPPEAKVPRNFAQLRAMWDMFRKKRKIPPRQLALAARVREAYLKKVQEMWVKHGEMFRSGNAEDRMEATSAIMKGAAVAFSRAKMIVETETTYYYNKTRRAVYDGSADVSHYLFMAIRDHRTTAWCKTRHGLVYSKSDPILLKEQPPCHWNCRSELLPLSIHNPRHRALIEDQSRQRRRNTCEPLPPEWTGR